MVFHRIPGGRVGYLDSEQERFLPSIAVSTGRARAIRQSPWFWYKKRVEAYVSLKNMTFLVIPGLNAVLYRGAC